MPSPFATEVVAAMRDIKEGGLSRDQFTEISKTMTRDYRRLGDAELLYFVIGNYDEGRGQKDRVTDTRTRISDYRPYTEEFILEEIDPEDELWENWYVKFLVFYRRATCVVGVFEDSHGGHELEAGEVDTADLYVLKRDYYTADGDADTETEYERFDGMIATYFDFLERRERLYRWVLEEGDEGDSLEAATQRLLDATVREYGP